MTDDALTRIAAALERLSPPAMGAPDFASADAFAWHVSPDRLDPVQHVARVDIGLLIGVDRSRDTLLENTRHFARGLPANNALLWGARGMGKSSLVKAVHAAVLAEGLPLKIVELSREDLHSVGRLLAHLRTANHQFILFCDDLSFSHDDQHYKSLKAVLDGGIEGRPENVILYATSNRRHLMPRDMIENERTIDRHQPIGSCGGKSIAFRPLWSVAWLSSLQSRGISANDPRVLYSAWFADQRR